MSTTHHHDWSRVLEGLSAAEVGPRVLVTGAGGFLGGHLVEALVELGCTVRALDLQAPDLDDQRVEGFQGDVRDPEVLARACADVDTVFHAAAIIVLHGLGPAEVARRVHSVNVGGTQAVVEACQAAGVGRLVFTSSHNVVLDRPLVEADEDTEYASEYIDLYTPSKVAAEKLVLAADSPGGLRTVALRPGGIWGRGGIMMRAFLGELVKGTIKAYIGAPTDLVDQTHVDTLLRAELLAAARLASDPALVGGQAYFITDDERINGMLWFEPVIRELGYPVPRFWLPAWLIYPVGWLMELVYKLGGPEPTLTRASVVKIARTSSLKVDKAREHLGWAPLWSRDTGVADMMDWIEAEHEQMLTLRRRKP